MKKKAVLDKDEERVLAEYERGPFRPVKNQDKAREEAIEAAHRHTRKERPDQYLPIQYLLHPTTPSHLPS